MAAMGLHWQGEFGGGLRLRRRCWAAAAAEEHAMMVLASAPSKPKAYYYNVDVGVGKDSKRGCI